METLMQTLNKISTRIFGWNAEYFLTEKTEDVIEGCENYNIKDAFNLKVLIPEKFNVNQNEMVIHISKSEFDEKKPSVKDIIYLKNRLHQVKNVATNLENGYYIIIMEKYEQFSVKK